jgi:hypothetical protein
MNRLIGVCVLAVAGTGTLAHAEPAPPPAAAPSAAAPVPPALPEAPAPSVVASGPPAPAAAPSVVAPGPPAPAADDHTSVVWHWGVGYQGISSLPIATGCCDTNGRPQLGSVNAPVIGVRHWFRDARGVDLGLGLGIQTGTAQPSASGFALHVGLPIVIAHRRHTAFEITPEATFGFATGTIPSPTPVVGPGRAYGVLLRAGARAGAEVHFGFIGLPELALQATVGLYCRTQIYALDQNNITIGSSSTLITTSVNDNPWGIFTDTISALYYF